MSIVLRIALTFLCLFAIPFVSAQTPANCKGLVHEPLSAYWRCKGNEERALEAECHEASGRFSAAYWRCVGNDKKALEAETEAFKKARAAATKALMMECLELHGEYGATFLRCTGDEEQARHFECTDAHPHPHGDSSDVNYRAYLRCMGDYSHALRLECADRYDDFSEKMRCEEEKDL